MQVFVFASQMLGSRLRGNDDTRDARVTFFCALRPVPGLLPGTACTHLELVLR